MKISLRSIGAEAVFCTAILLGGCASITGDASLVSRLTPIAANLPESDSAVDYTVKPLTQAQQDKVLMGLVNTGQLIDPYSAMVSGSKSYPIRELNGKMLWVCGRINAKNRMGGYTGNHAYFLAVPVDFSSVNVVELDNGDWGAAALHCSTVLQLAANRDAAAKAK